MSLVLGGISQDRPQYLFNRSHVHHGGYGAFVMKYSEINGEPALFLGGQGAWVIDRSLGIGFAGYGLALTESRGDIVAGEDLNLVMGYGGLLLEPVFLSNQLIHLELPVVIGGGYAQYFYQGYDEWSDWEESYGPGDMFFLIEPGANVTLNLSRHVRLGAGVTYRWLNDVDRLPATTTSDLEGLSYSLSIKIGAF